MTNYATIPPVGQFDDMACWAACLTWWLRAVRGGRPSWSQTQVLAEYTRHCDDDGSFPPDAIRRVWTADTRLRVSAGTFNSQSYWGSGLPMGDPPVMIGFVHPSAGTHMNVLFNQRGRTVQAMEPFHPYPGRDGHRTGRILERSVDFYVRDNYTRSHEIMLFWPTVAT